MRIALKEIESLSFNIEECSSLRNLSADLKSILVKHGANVCCDKGLIVRPKPTNSIAMKGPID